MMFPREAFLAARHSPAGHRLRLARKSLGSSWREYHPSLSEKCQIDSIDHFESAHAQLAAALGRPGKTPSPEHTEFFRFLSSRGRSFAGIINDPDCFFITAFVSVLAPTRVVEIGTLTGFSAAVLASAIIRENGYNGRAVVDTIDRATECCVAPAPIGFEVPQILPDFPAAVRLRPGRDSDFVREIVAPNELELALIDASHNHPWPLIDLLRLAPFVRGGGWILLHDIKLGTLGAEMKARGESSEFDFGYGAEWLFDSWPFRKISGGNTGAVQIPQTKSDLHAFGVQLARIPFEAPKRKDRELRRSIYRALSQLT